MADRQTTLFDDGSSEYTIQIVDTHINKNTTNSLETLSKDNDNIRYQEGHLKKNI